MDKPFQNTGGIVAVHARKTALGQIEPIVVSIFGQAMDRRLANILGGIVDQDGLKAAYQHIQIVAAVAGKHGIGFLKRFIGH